MINTDQIIKSVENLKQEELYILAEPEIHACPQVTGLTTICLSYLQNQSIAKANLTQYAKTKAFDSSRKVFHSKYFLETKETDKIINTGKNAIMSLALSICDEKDSAKSILDFFERSNLYNSNHQLFEREYSISKKYIDSRIITQTNAWIALTYISLNMPLKAKKIISKLENYCYDKEKGLFSSYNVMKNDAPKYFLDDQAIISIIYWNLGNKIKATNLIEKIYESPLKDYKSGLLNNNFSNSKIDSRKSTYKNSFLATALNLLNKKTRLKKLTESLEKELFDSKKQLFNQTTNSKLKISDNTLLGLIAIKETKEFLNFNQ